VRGGIGMSNERRRRDEDEVAGVEDRNEGRRIVIDADQVVIRANRVIILDESDDRKNHDRNDRNDDRNDDRRDDRRNPFWWI
jgi:hypothetical protein